MEVVERILRRSGTDAPHRDRDRRRGEHAHRNQPMQKLRCRPIAADPVAVGHGSSRFFVFTIIGRDNAWLQAAKTPLLAPRMPVLMNQHSARLANPGTAWENMSCL